MALGNSSLVSQDLEPSRTFQKIHKPSENVSS